VMCEVCRLAGRKLKGNHYLPAGVTPSEYAQAMHKLCPYPNTCTCQHREGNYDAASPSSGGSVIR
jgi:hypothetical protein